MELVVRIKCINNLKATFEKNNYHVLTVRYRYLLAKVRDMRLEL